MHKRSIDRFNQRGKIRFAPNVTDEEGKVYKYINNTENDIVSRFGFANESLKERYIPKSDDKTHIYPMAGLARSEGRHLHENSENSSYFSNKPLGYILAIIFFFFLMDFLITTTLLYPTWFRRRNRKK